MLTAGTLWGLVNGLTGAELWVDFEDVERGTPPMEAYSGPGGGGYYNGSDEAGGFWSGGVHFANTYVVAWGSWSGWAYSTTTDRVTEGFLNQYSAYPGSAADGEVYAVTYAPSGLELPVGWKTPVSVKVANVTYGALSMLNGDAFAKRFGDDPATADVVETDYPDYLKLIVSGLDLDGQTKGLVEVYLADYRGDAATDHVLDTWKEVDLSPLGTGVASLSFTLESTDVGSWGINTPAYLAVDALGLSSSETWAGYDWYPDGWVDTGEYLGLIYPVDGYIYIMALEAWASLGEDAAEAETGSWVYFHK